jgi:GntR family transcriptional regulator/MocR family aminotransferase
LPRAVLWLDLDRKAPVSLTQQLYDRLVSAVLQGTLRPGERLPSSRQLAQDLRVARNIVMEVFAQLQTEGYFESRTGSGTYVAQLDVPVAPARSAARPAATPPAAKPADVIDFRCGIPDLAAFPRARWLQAVRQAGFHGPSELWSYEEAAGHRGLREEIALHLGRSKGIACHPDQIVLTGGSAHGMTLLGLYFNQTKRGGALVEDPVISFVPEALRLTGHKVTPVRADAQGLVITALPRRPRAGLVFISPSHQFPLGGTLPITRRLALLAYARKHGLLVIEDDYDSEFRFEGAPVSSLCRLDPTRVIHLGTFSKSLAPTLRLGYLVLPPAEAERLVAMLRPLYLAGPRFNQEVMARFMRAGHFQRHVARMKRRYQRKMQALCRALRARFGDRVQINGHTTGLHLTVNFTGRAITPAIHEACLRAGVSFDTVDDYTLRAGDHPNLALLGFGDLSLEEIQEGVRRLARVLG